MNLDPSRARLDRTNELSPAILHVDMDAFFAEVERLDNPELLGKPVVVGGTGQRGVVASCTYEARAYGVRSAMPTAKAKQLCPNAIFLNGRHSRYSEVSKDLHTILAGTTPLVESVGLDEAFLDVSGCKRLMGSPLQIAQRLRLQIHSELNLNSSVGVGRSKLISKLASRAAKPRASRQGIEAGPGVTVVLAHEELDFLHPLLVQALWGVGPATTRRLNDLGVRTVGDLCRLPPGVLTSHFGDLQGSHLTQLAMGRDDRPVVPGRAAKSLGHEETFRHDLFERSELRHHVLRMSDAVANALVREGVAGRTVMVKIRFADFETITRSHTLPSVVDSPAAIDTVAGALLEGVELRAGVRLLGVSVSGIQPRADAKQLSFALSDAGSSAPEGSSGQLAASVERLSEELAGVVSSIRTRFGLAAVGVASMLGDDGLSVSSQLQAPWGPSAEPEDSLRRRP